MKCKSGQGMTDQLCRPLAGMFLEDGRKLASRPWCKSATRRTWNWLSLCSDHGAILFTNKDYRKLWKIW